MENKGFIRFATDSFFKPCVEKFEKMFSISGTMKNSYPTENNPEYEKYPYKNFLGYYTEPSIACPAEVFCYRYFNMWMKYIKQNAWMRFSYTDKNKFYRVCKTLYVLCIRWVNHPYHQVLEVKGLNVDGSRDSFNINLVELADLCVHVCTKDESTSLSNMLNESMPEPYIPLFKVYKDIYSKNYNLYLSDCERFGVKPIPEVMITNARQDFYIDVNSGCITGMNDDCYVVNVFPTNG